jgi:Flp pilus assembly protein TadG
VRLLLHKRGSVALLTAVMAPVMIMTLALGIEVSWWSLTKVELQRIADVAAWAGARQYVVTTSAQSATSTAADLAEVNGATGGTRSWASPTLTDNSITAQIVSGVRNASDTAVKVTVTRSIAKSFSNIFPSAQKTVTVSATAVAEIVNAMVGTQPCLLALNTDDDGGVSDITFSGNANVTSTNCSVRSNSGIKLGGNTTLDVEETRAGGGINVSGNADIKNQEFQNSGQISDPYASYTPLQNAFSRLGSSGSAQNVSNGTITINPGTYSSISVSSNATLIMNPGIYIINGNISFSGNAIVTGSGVTIVSSGTMSANGNASVSLTAPLSGASTGIPGIMYASNSNQSSSFGGNTVVPFAGVIYYPNGNLSFSGNAGDGDSGCSEVIAGRITISGDSRLSSNCTSYGTMNFGSMPSTTSIALVQ